MKVVAAVLRLPHAIWRELTSLVDSPGMHDRGSTARSDHGQLSDEGWLAGSTAPDRAADERAAEQGLHPD